MEQRLGVGFFNALTVFGTELPEFQFHQPFQDSRLPRTDTFLHALVSSTLHDSAHLLPLPWVLLLIKHSLIFIQRAVDVDKIRVLETPFLV